MKLSLSRDNFAAEDRVLAAFVFMALLVFGSAAHAEDRTIPPTTAANQNCVVSRGGR